VLLHQVDFFMLTVNTYNWMLTMSTSEDKKTNDSYHHGNLREALLKAATEILEEEGRSAGWSLSDRALSPFQG